MTRLFNCDLLALLLVALIATTAMADEKTAGAEKGKEPAAEEKDQGGDKEEESEPEEEPKRKTVTVEPKRLKVDVTIDTTFVARNTTEIVLEPKNWSKFTIEEVVEHGAEVRAGDQLIRFDREPLDKAIADLDLSLRIGEIALTKAEADLPRLEKSLDMRLASAERSDGYTQEDYDDYRENGRDLALLGYGMSLKRSRMAFESAREELEQLEKMYDADDLTEETEEIVLKRQRQQVEISEAYLKMAEHNYKRSMEMTLPRGDVSRAESLDRSKMSLEQARLAHKLDLNAARYSLEKQRKSREQNLEKHAELVADRGLMTVKAPAAGVVYYGRSVNGKWSDLSSMLTKLKPKKTASKNQVLMTIVDPSELYLYGTVAEKHLPSLAAGQAALVTPTADGADPMRASLATVSDVPVSAGKYAVEIDLRADALPAWLDPGMMGKAKITTYDNKAALVVPKKAVHTDEFDETVKYVWLVTKEETADADEDDDEADEDEADDDGYEEEDDADEAEEKVEKRFVKLGKSKGDDVEIVDGVAAGDVLSLEDEDKKKDED